MKNKRDIGIRPKNSKKTKAPKQSNPKASKPKTQKNTEKKISTRSLKGKLERELLSEKKYIEERLETLKVEPSENGGDFGDMSSALSDEGMIMIERERLLKKLSSVTMVLSRVKNNPNFANCDDCGEEIDLKRLVFMPTARRCVYCQQISEKND